MTDFRKWPTPTAVLACLGFIATLVGYAGWQGHRAREAERARRALEEHQARSLEPIIRYQRFELNRIRLQLKAIGNPPLPHVTPEEIDQYLRADDPPPRVQPADPPIQKVPVPRPVAE